MKKEINNDIIKKVESIYSMIFKTRTAKVIFSSVACFILGIGISLAGLYTINKFQIQNGVGGLEASNEYQFTTNLESLLVEESKNITNKESLNLIEEIENPQGEDQVLLSSQENSINKPAEDLPPENQLTYLTYRVKKGDMIGVIADDFGITQDTIISINNIKQSRLIQVGQYLKIPSIPGILYTVKENGETPESIAKKYEIDSQKCAQVNSLSHNASLSVGTSIFVPDAELDWATRQEINGDLFKKPIRSRYWLSSAYGWRDSPFNTGKRSFHGGIDMACSTGTNVYAALDGKVTSTGYNSVYGNFVIITHHSGYKSLYGHLNKITCKKGNFVYTNTKIGEVGSTGLSTGPHLHFTVYKHGKTVNPMGLFN